MSCPHGEWHDTDCEICKQLDAKDAEIESLREEIWFAHRAQKDMELTAGKAWATVALRDAEIARLREDAAEQVAKERGET